MQETWVPSLGQEDPLEKEITTHSSFLAQKIPWTEKPGGYSPWGHKESGMIYRTKQQHGITTISRNKIRLKNPEFLPSVAHGLNHSVNEAINLLNLNFF